MHRIVDSRCVLAVRDLQASTRFYVDVLGFRRDFGDGSDGWSFLSRDAFKIMLGECAGEKPASELGNHPYVAYLIVEGVDQFHADVAERGAGCCPNSRPNPGACGSSASAHRTGILSDSENRPTLPARRRALIGKAVTGNAAARKNGTLLDSAARAEILRRIEALTPRSDAGGAG